MACLTEKEWGSEEQNVMVCATETTIVGDGLVYFYKGQIFYV